MQAIRETTPPEVKRQVDLSFQISNRVYELLEQKNMSQKDLAKRLGKTETEVSRWLGGTHNLTLATIAKLSVALDDDIIQTTSSLPGVKAYNLDNQDVRPSVVADDSEML